MWKVEARLYRSNFKHKTRLPVEMIRAFAERRFREGVDAPLGHFHKSWTGQVGSGRVEILPRLSRTAAGWRSAMTGARRWSGCRCQV